MSENQNSKIIKTIVKNVQKYTEHPEKFLSVQDDAAEKFKELTKSLYEYSRSNQYNVHSKTILPSLILDDMDEEQIWQQLELNNAACWTQCLEETSKILSLPDDKFALKLKNEEDEENNSENEDESEEEIENDEIEAEDIENDEFQRSKNQPKSIVDDDFFKLHEMNQFLEDEDRKEMRKEKGFNKDNNEDDEDDIYLFEDIDDADSEDEEGNVNYADFFGKDGETKIDTKLYGRKKLMRKRKHMRNEDLGEEDSEIEEEKFDEEEDDANDTKEIMRNVEPAKGSSSDDDDNDAEEEDEPQSSYQIREKRLQSRIKRMEEEALEAKSWQLRGEIDNKARPLNSLLEEVLDFDSSVRPAPLITEETSMKLEDIIKQRIKDKLYDDVVRKIKPKETAQEYRQKLILDQEKSKDSLVKIYEKEYIKQVDNLTSKENTIEEKPREHQEITILLKSVISKLDALSNFHYTPKCAAPEFKIITNTPAIQMEDVAPVAISNATLLAPEEIKEKSKGDAMSKNERTKTDKNRERRKSKLKNKHINKLKEEKLLNGKISKSEEKETLLNKVIKQRNVEKMKISDDNKHLKSSKAFFTQLQDTTDSKLSKNKISKKNNKNKSKSASLYKL